MHMSQVDFTEEEKRREGIHISHAHGKNLKVISDKVTSQ